jgi:serine/threonine protein kinase
VHTFEDDQNIYILLEYIEGQELFHEIKAQQALKQNYAGVNSSTKSGALDESQASSYFREIALGVKYMQEKNILHRDLKLSNVMLNQNKQIKIIDFGLAIQLMDFVEEETTICGTPNYISPETISGKRFGP